MNKDEIETGVLEIEFQCKSICSGTNYHKLLNEMPGKTTRCVLHQYTEKSSGGKFMEKGTYAILPMEDFIKILKLNS